jgi:uncharacterized protein (DUF1778 family)
VREGIMKNERLQVRTASAERTQFESAAAFLGMNLSSFMRLAALEKSSEVLKSRDSILLSNEDRDLFLQSLENPPKPNNAMKKALKDYRKKLKS